MDRKAARTLRGIHFILGAHDGRYIKWPYQEGETYIVQSYKKGMYTGRLDLKIQNPGTAFQDEDRTRRLRQQLGDLNRRLEALKRAQQRRPTETLKRTIDRIQRQKAQLQSELEAGNMPHSSANRFRWSLHPLVLSLPEDETVRSWIQKSGIRKD
jgi:2',3'-cyclic-nucleotide 2'-phosphodiesterase (5'-nucleotidase family)